MISPNTTVKPVLDNPVVATVATTTQIPTTSTSAMTMNTTLFQTTLTPQTSTIFNSVDQGGSIISTAKIAGAAAGGVIMIVLCLAITVLAIKRCRVIFKGKEIQMIKWKTVK